MNRQKTRREDEVLGRYFSSEKVFCWLRSLKITIYCYFFFSTFSQIAMTTRNDRRKITKSKTGSTVAAIDTTNVRKKPQRRGGDRA